MIRSTPTTPATGTYRIAAARATVGFETNHLFGITNVAGTFAVRCGHIVIASPVTASTAAATVDAASFSTVNRRRDAAVRLAKFLDIADHPDITFTSHGLRSEWVLHGELTVRATTHPVELTVEHVQTRDGELRAEATALIDRYFFEAVCSDVLHHGDALLADAMRQFAAGRARCPRCAYAGQLQDGEVAAAGARTTSSSTTSPPFEPGRRHLVTRTAACGKVQPWRRCH